MLRKILLWLFLVAITGCTNAGVKNSADFATSLNELAKREVLSNLQKVFDDRATFVPSHVVVSTGKSTTSGTIAPSFFIPLGPGYSNTVVPTGNNQFTGVTSFGAGSVTLGGNVMLSQEWSMTPATDADALMRLRTLYLYVTGKISGLEEFLCNYPVQRQPVTLDGAKSNRNIAYHVACAGRSDAIFYADPNFVTLPNCIVCITSAGLVARTERVKKAGAAPSPAKAEAEILLASEVTINDRLRRDIVYPSKIGKREPGDRDLSHDLGPGPAWSRQEILPELPQISLETGVYLKAGNEVPFRDFILFTYVAMAQTTASKEP